MVAMVTGLRHYKVQKKKEKICKNLYNFEELSLLYKTYGLRGNSPYNYT